MRVAIIGAAGRMGKVLIEAVDGTEGLELGAAIVEPGSSLIGADAGEMTGIGKTGVKMAASLDDVKDDFDVLVDFTFPDLTLENAKFCSANGKMLVIGTTGMTDAEKEQLALAAENFLTQRQAALETATEQSLAARSLAERTALAYR